ncbi:formimidoylglutamate deiminase [Cellulomonas soli]|uniref:formimidoylglutamate deiminase n=1 Tax=Cellulomonas soli TaxID=931535 RepID=UPI003F841E88
MSGQSADAAAGTTYWCPAAWLPHGLAHRVRVEVTGDRITAVTPDVDAAPQDVRLPGVVLPGLANTHSHAFHRALRGRTHGDGGTFWTWRERMYALAGTLTPETYLDLARATYAEMALAGATAVGEFHYLHHAPDGRSYAEPNVMAEALREAARDAGVRVTLLDTCYLAGGVEPGTGAPRPLVGAQRRFADADVEAWAARSGTIRADAHLRPAAAVHSVRAVTRRDLVAVADVVRDRGVPLHVHVSEQPAENTECLAAHGTTPTGLLAETGALGPATTAVHAVHLTADDIALLGSARAAVSVCPSTEQDLGDGLAPVARLHAAGVRLSVGSDQHVLTDLLGEARLVEMHARLADGTRGLLSPADLTVLLTADGHTTLGDAGAGRIEVGARADLVAVRTDTPRTAGASPGQIVLVAGSSDVDTVISGGAVVVSGGVHRLGDVGRLMGQAVDAAWSAADGGGR